MAEVSFDEIYDRALRLSAEDRQKLARDLIVSLGPGPIEKDEGYDEAWAEEILRRSDAIHDGLETTLSAEEFFAGAREFLDQLQADRSARQADSPGELYSQANSGLFSRSRKESLISSSSDVVALAFEMPEDRRADLACRLFDSLDHPSADSDRDPAWAAEIEGRLRDMDEGRAEIIPWDEASKRLDESLNRHRRS